MPVSRIERKESLERSSRGREEVEVTLPRMRYGYPQVQTPDGYGRHPYAKNGSGKGSFGH